MIRTLLVVTLLASSFTGAFAQAQKRAGSAAEQQACSKDVSRYCQDVINSSDLVILGCLKANRSSISKPCEKVLQDNNQ